MAKPKNGWDASHWGRFIIANKDYYDMVLNNLGGHHKLYQARSYEDFLVCTGCYQFFTKQETHTCSTGVMVSFQEVVQGDKRACKAFAHAWLESVLYTPSKNFKPRGAARGIPNALMGKWRRALLSNADNLVDEAILLFNNSKFPRAGLLALVAQEEFVKMFWASIEGQNRETYFYLFPIEGYKPGFTFQRLYLAMRGLRLETTADSHERFSNNEERKNYDLLDHDKKLAIVRASRPFFSRSAQLILTLDHHRKYRLLYGESKQLSARCRYVDLDFRHSIFTIPDTEMPRGQAYDHTLFAAALCHDWSEHGFCDQSGKVRLFGPHEGFLKRTQQRYQDFLGLHPDTKSQVFPTPQFTTAEKAQLA